MVCDAVQHNQIEPFGGNSGLRPFCIATPFGFFIGDNTMKKISLTQGKFAIVDDEDYEWLSQWKWYAVKKRNSFYVERRSPTDPCTHKSSKVSMHRVIMDAIKGKEVDHINHDTLDNRRSNLRLCTASENQQNRRPQSNCSSRFKGVCRDRRRRKWGACIYINGKRIGLGSFDSETDAAEAYDKKAQELFGEFAYTNSMENKNKTKSREILPTSH